jgi:alkaline phosphatase
MIGRSAAPEPRLDYGLHVCHGARSIQRLMKLRNQLLALFCLLIFIGFGVLFFKNWVVQKPFAIILFTGDGMAARILAAARQYEGGADHRLTIQTLPNVALVLNHSEDFAVPDAAASATAIATGVQVNNKAIAVDPDGTWLKSIVDWAREKGRATGLVTNGNLTDAANAAFYSHASDSTELESISAQFLDGAKFDVALGGGAAHFIPESKGGLRKDGRDLTLEMRQRGRDLIRSKAELENTPLFRTANLIGLFSPGNMAYGNQMESGSQQPSLSDMVRRSIELLQYHRGGYFLVVNAELISRAASQNDAEHLLTETLELDRAVQTAISYAGEKALIIVTGRHGIGGMTLNGYPLRQDQGVGLLGTNAAGYPSIVWATGPNGPLQTAENAASADKASAPAAFHAPAAINNAEDVIAAGSGPGSAGLRGFIEHTAIFKILKDQL